MAGSRPHRSVSSEKCRPSDAAASRQSTSVCPAFSSMRLMPLALMRWMTFCSRASEMDSRIKRSFISIFLQFAAGGRLQVGKDEAVQVASTTACTLLLS